MERCEPRLREHLLEAKGLCNDYFFLALQGSQNYNLNYENSDIDTKMLTLPSFEEFALNKQPLSNTHIMPNNEHVDMKDIRVMFGCFWKQNINFLEILFSKYNIVNPEYKDEFNALYALREDIAHYNNYAAVNCMAGMAHEKYKALKHPYPATAEKIAKYGYDGKQLHHIMRMDEFMTGYLNGLSFEECLTSYPKYGRDNLLLAKKNGFCLEYAEELSAKIIHRIDGLKDGYMSTHPVVVNNQVRKEAEEVMVEVLKKNFRKQIA